MIHPMQTGPATLAADAETQREQHIQRLLDGAPAPTPAQLDRVRTLHLTHTARHTTAHDAGGSPQRLAS